MATAKKTSATKSGTSTPVPAKKAAVKKTAKPKDAAEVTVQEKPKKVVAAKKLAPIEAPVLQTPTDTTVTKKTGKPTATKTTFSASAPWPFPTYSKP